MRRLQVSNDPKFTGAVWEPYAASRAWPINTAAATTVSVRFRDGAGNVSKGVKRKLTTTTSPTIPTQIAPVHLQTQASRTPTFRWAALAGATHYQLQVASASTFTAGSMLLTKTVAATLLTPRSALPANQTLYWRVRKSGGAWSPTWRFKAPALQAPVLTAPADKATVASLAPSLSWHTVTGATSYQVRLGVEPTFSSGVHTFASATTAIDLAPLAAGATYHWQVRPKLGAAFGG